MKTRQTARRAVRSKLQYLAPLAFLTRGGVIASILALPTPRPKSSQTKMAEETEFYEPPCRQLLRERHLCNKCGKRLTLHTLLYRHICDPMEARRERVVQLVREVAQEQSSAASGGQHVPTAPAKCSVSPHILARVGGFGSNISRTSKCR